MSKSTKISWADSTASPWFGCTEVSPGCLNCYAREMTLKRKWAGWGDSAPRVRSKGFWKDIPAWDRKAGQINGTQGYEFYRPRIFPSLMDWLDPKVPIEWLSDFLNVIHDCPHLDFLLLTKRPELFVDRIGKAARVFREGGSPCLQMLCNWGHHQPPGNVWVGVTCEDQKRADERIPELLKIPATVRFLSCEPLLGPIDLRLSYAVGVTQNANTVRGDGIHWVIVGGESGPKRRDCGVDAICQVTHQCFSAHVPVWVKQDCAFNPGQQGRIPDDVWCMKHLPKS